MMAVLHSILDSHMLPSTLNDLFFFLQATWRWKLGRGKVFKVFNCELNFAKDVRGLLK